MLVKLHGAMSNLYQLICVKSKGHLKPTQTFTDETSGKQYWVFDKALDDEIRKSLPEGLDIELQNSGKSIEVSSKDSDDVFLFPSLVGFPEQIKIKPASNILKSLLSYSAIFVLIISFLGVFQIHEYLSANGINYLLINVYSYVGLMLIGHYFLMISAFAFAVCVSIFYPNWLLADTLDNDNWLCWVVICLGILTLIVFCISFMLFYPKYMHALEYWFAAKKYRYYSLISMFMIVGVVLLQLLSNKSNFKFVVSLLIVSVFVIVYSALLNAVLIHLYHLKTITLLVIILNVFLVFSPLYSALNKINNKVVSKKFYNIIAKDDNISALLVAISLTGLVGLAGGALYTLHKSMHENLIQYSALGGYQRVLAYKGELAQKNRMPICPKKDSVSNDMSKECFDYIPKLNAIKVWVVLATNNRIVVAASKKSKKAYVFTNYPYQFISFATRAGSF